MDCSVDLNKLAILRRIWFPCFFFFFLGVCPGAKFVGANLHLMFQTFVLTVTEIQNY